MTGLGAVLAFTAAAALLTLTPGLDTALVLRTGAVEGRAKAMQAALGIGLGCLAWGLAVGAGLGALLLTSRLAYDALRWAGALYLMVLGARMLLAPRQSLGAVATAPADLRPSNWFLRGFLTNLLNPKVGVFYVSFLPQFIPAGANVLAWSAGLTAIHSLLGIAWFTALLTALGGLFTRLQSPTTLRRLDRLGGAVFISFGLKLALDARS